MKLTSTGYWYQDLDKLLKMRIPVWIRKTSTIPTIDMHSSMVVYKLLANKLSRKKIPLCEDYSVIVLNQISSYEDPDIVEYQRQDTGLKGLMVNGARQVL